MSDDAMLDMISSYFTSEYSGNNNFCYRNVYEKTQARIANTLSLLNSNFHLSQPE
jgi:hypothetical protein